MKYLIVGLSIFGLLMVADASVVTAARDFSNKWYYLRYQGLWTLLGLSVFVFFSKFPSTKLEKYSLPIFLLSLATLVLVLIPGIGTRALGAHRWLWIFQPGELAKLALAIYISGLFKSSPKFSSLALIASLVGGLILFQPDMGSSLTIVGMCFLSYVGSGGKLRHIFFSLPIIAALIFLLIVSSPYRFQRVRSFLSPSSDPTGASYHIRQAVIGLGSGGLFGTGLGQSRQKYEFLPEVTTDSIFAVIGEELGLLGTGLTLTALTLVALTGLQISYRSKTPFTSTLALSISSWLGLQSFINMSAVVALLPFTGIPLPFVSYGGSALFVALAGSGILVNISQNNK